MLINNPKYKKYFFDLLSDDEETFEFIQNSKSDFYGLFCKTSNDYWINNKGQDFLLKQSNNFITENIVNYFNKLSVTDSNSNLILYKTVDNNFLLHYRFIEHYNSIYILFKGNKNSNDQADTDELEKKIDINTNDLKFYEIFDVEKIQELQDLFASVTGVASIITDTSGVPLTAPSNFCKLCNEIIRKTGKGRINCFKSDSELGKVNTTAPNISPCLSGGLWDAGVSLMFGKRHVANWLIGQVKNSELDENKILNYADEIGVNRDVFKDALAEVKELSLEQFTSISNFLFKFTELISTIAHKNFIYKNLLEIKNTQDQALLENEERLRLSLKATKQGLYDLNIQTGDALVNDEYALMLGYEPSEFHETNDFWLRRLHPNDHERCKRVFNDYISGKISEYKVEFRQKTKQGNWIWILSLGKIVEYDDKNMPLRMLGTHTNINEKMLAEEKMQLASQMFRDLVNSIPTAILIYQFQEPDSLLLVDGNNYAEKISNIKISEQLGCDFSSIWTNANKVGLKEKFINVINSGRFIEYEDLNYTDDKLSGAFKVTAFAMPGKKLGVAFNSITEIKVAKQALSRSEERYKMIIENQNDLIIKIDVENRLLYVSPSFSKLFGKREVELLGSTLLQFVHPEDMPNTLIQMESLHKHPFTCYLEHRAMTSNGWRWLGWSYKSILDDNSNIHSIIGIGRDITQSKYAEESIREKNFHLQFLADTAFTLSGIIDYDSTINFICNKLKDFTGSLFVAYSDYSVETKTLNTKKVIGSKYLIEKTIEIIGKNIENFKTNVPKDIYDTFLEKNIIESNSFSFITNGQIPEFADKTLKFISGINKFFAIAFITSGEIYGVAIIAIKENQNIPNLEVLKSFANISAISIRRIKAENQVKVLSRGIEQSPVFVVITNKKAEIEYVNSYITKVTGYQASDLIGKNPNVFKSGMTPESTYDQLWDSLNQGRVWTGEFLNRKKNGEIYWEKAIISPVTDNLGNITNFIAVKQDITELKTMTEELINAKEKAEENDKLKTAFIQNMSHEIRTPLNGIMGYSQLLKMSNIDELEHEKYLTTIIQSSKRLMEIVNNLLEISRIETGQTNINLHKTKVANIITELYDFFLLSANNKGIDLIFDIDKEAENLAILTDEQKVNQILTNLLGNALKFTNNGYIKFGCRIENHNLMFFVKDTGTGIPPQQHIRIFERFYQGSTKLSRDYEGAGLGLSICKGFVNLLGGDIWVESAVGSGSTFYFTIPNNT
ncbi:hypothetical protein MASR1M45_27460 [Candidatus Kapaibacterium sp.]